MPTIQTTPPPATAPEPKTPPPLHTTPSYGVAQSHHDATDAFFTCEPARRFIFRSALDKPSTETLSITNNSPETLLYKVKTNEHRTYAVKSGSGLIEPHTTAEVQIIQRPLRAFPRAQDVARHRFLVVAAPISSTPKRSGTKSDGAADLWNLVPHNAVRKRTLGVVVKQSAFYIPLEQLVTFKPATLAFVPSTNPNGSCCSHLDITNISEYPIVFKMKTTNQMGYVVRPRVGIIDPHQRERIELSSQPKSKRMDINGEITANPIVPVSRPTSHDKFKLEVAAVHSENLLGNVTPQDLWPRVLAGDVSTMLFPVLRNADPRKLSPSELPDHAAHRLQDAFKRLNSSAGKLQLSSSFVDTLEDVLFWTPKVLRLRAENEAEHQPSILHLSNISDKTLLYRIVTVNTGLYEIYPQKDIIAPYDSLNVSVSVQNMKFSSKNWDSLSDEASIEVTSIDLKPGDDLNKDENDLNDMWAAVSQKDVMKVKFDVQIRNVL
eukprot:TRINITY_DN814_c0_g4_i1.p3 TRINITY_DN814_c0_g4~~TRINITY_DN814_c0_g4_i1.p3  ORF type:complete len:492 (+),score=89.07 TRINITY_DN814_c0_g4_i1:2318-3793(+)